MVTLCDSNGRGQHQYHYQTGLTSAVWADCRGIYPFTTLDGLRKGKTKAVEHAPVQPVSDAIVDKTLEHIANPVVADMIRLQRLTGMRPGELFIMRPADLDRSGDVWRYVPQTHKNEHRGKSRTVFIGGQGQKILAPYLLRPGDAFCFTRRNGEPFERWHYQGAIRRTCQQHGIPRWHPHQLRHSAATKIRKHFGIEAASNSLGHANLKTTEVYAEKSEQQAEEVARRLG